MYVRINICMFVHMYVHIYVRMYYGHVHCTCMLINTSLLSSGHPQCENVISNISLLTQQDG